VVAGHGRGRTGSLTEKLVRETSSADIVIPNLSL
jgi:hypothetical protein